MWFRKSFIFSLVLFALLINFFPVNAQTADEWNDKGDDSASTRTLLKKSKWGFINKKGEFIIPPEFDRISNFSEGLASVEINGKFGYIDRTGKILIQTQSFGGDFSEGLASIKVNGKCCYINKTGKIVIQTQYDEGYGFSEGLAVIIKNGKCGYSKEGYIDKTGKVVIQPQFLAAYHFSEGLAKVLTYDNTFGYIDKTGKMVVKPYYIFAGNFSEGVAFVGTWDGKYFIIDKSGSRLKLPGDVYLPCYPNFSEGLAYIKINNKWCYIDKIGKIVIQLQSDSDESACFSEGLSYAKINNKWCYIDKKGKIVMQPQSESDGLGHFSEGLAIIEINNKFGYIDKTGKIVIRPQFDKPSLGFISSFSEGLAGVSVQIETFAQSVDDAYELNDKGDELYNKSDYKNALSKYEEALKIYRKNNKEQEISNSLLDIGGVYEVLGDYSKALDYYTKALEIDRKIGDVKGEGADLTGIGNVYLDLGDYPNALEYYTKALEIDRKIGDVKGEGADLNNIGVVYHDLCDYSKALDYYTKVLEIKKKIRVPYDLQEANIGDVYLEIGKLEKAYEIYTKLGYPIRLGRYYLAIKDYKKAKEQFSRSLIDDEKSLNAAFLLSDYTGLGLLEEGLKNYKEAEKYYKKAVDLLEHQRESLTDAQRKHFFEGKVMNFSRLIPYEGLVRVYHYLNLDNEGFLYSESTKARLLSEEIARKYEGTDFSLPSEVTKKEKDLINKIASIYKQIEIAYKENNQERLKELERELKPLKAEQEKFITILRQSYPEYASIMYPKPLKLEEIKLNSGEVLIEYEVTDTETIAYLIKDGKIVKASSIQISRDDLTTLVKVYRGSFEGIKDYSELGNFSPETGKKLYDLLLKDLLSEVKGEKIIIVPDDILGILPFEALLTELPSTVQFKQGQYGPCPEGVKYVGDVYSINYYQSASGLSMVRNLNKGGGKRGVFSVADPVFSDKDERITGIAQVNPITDLEILRMDAIQNNGGFSFSRLKLTGDMAGELDSIFPGEIENITGTNATEKVIKSKDLSGYKYLLFATHGILDDDVPYIKEPALVLALIGNKEEDGFLTMGEVMNMKMGANVAVLSACKTGLGRNVSGEGIMGMGRAFQYAGVKSVLMSLWSVESVSTNMMTEKFFEGLKQGKSNREALRDARAYIRSQGYEHPFFWAPFILVGD